MKVEQTVFANRLNMGSNKKSKVFFELGDWKAEVAITETIKIVSGLGWAENQEFSFEHINFEMPTRYPHEELTGNQIWESGIEEQFRLEM